MGHAKPTAAKQSNAQEAYDEVLRRIRTGEVKKNDKIVDVNLAGELDMSRMPAREALLRLANEGYLVGTTRGFKLPDLSNRDIMEIFEIRRLLEPRAAAAAAVQLDENHIDAMRKAYERAAEAVRKNNPLHLMGANTAFRDIWLDQVPNKRLVTTIARFVDQVHAVRIATLHDRKTRIISLNILANLLDGFTRGDSLYVHDQMLYFVDEARIQFEALSKP